MSSVAPVNGKYPLRKDRRRKHLTQSLYNVVILSSTNREKTSRHKMEISLTGNRNSGVCHNISNTLLKKMNILQ